MKKKLLSGLLVLGAASMLCGFDSAETVDTLSDKIKEASASIDSMSIDMTFNLDADLNMSDGTTDSSMGIGASGDFIVDYTMDPVAMKMTGEMNYSAILSQSAKMEMYGVTDENGVFKTYAYVEDSSTGEGSWTATTMDDMNMTELMEKSRSSSLSFSDLEDLGIGFTLAPEAVDVDGTECYLLSASLDSTTFTSLLNKAAEITGQDIMGDGTIATALSLLDGLKINLEYYVGTEDYLTVKTHLDLNGSDFGALSELLSSTVGSGSEDAAPTTMDLVLNDCSFDMISSYDSVEPITVPEEALSAETVDEESLSDLADSIKDTAASE